MLSEKARSQQTALWELVETEVAYIRTLKVIQDVSKKFSFKTHHQLVYDRKGPKIDQEYRQKKKIRLIFSNFTKIET